MTRGRRLPLVLAPLVAVALFAGCSDGETSDPENDCEASMQEAAGMDSNEQAITDIDPAIANCPDVASFVDASNKYPDALMGQDPNTVISDRCADTAEGDICDEIAP
ncbi:MAG: hypothetical protein AAGF73_17120 [Actinomycetota bacterium]